MHYFIFILWVGGFSGAVQATAVYQCNEKGTISFQSKPCEGTGKTVADHLAEKQQAKEKRLAEIQEKERQLQERLKQQPPKQSAFDRLINKLSHKFAQAWKVYRQS